MKVYMPGDRAFAVAGPRVWNTLPDAIGGAHRSTLSNAHWKLIYTFSVTSNTFIGLLVSRDIYIVSLKWLFTYGTLNSAILHYITHCSGSVFDLAAV